MKSNLKTFVLLAGAGLLVVLGVTALFWTFRQIEVSAQKRTHTSDVLKRAKGLLSSLTDAETGMRGYLLTGDKAFLESYLAVRDDISGQMEELRQITLIGASRTHVDALTPLVDEKMAHLSRAIELYHNGDTTAAIETVSSGEGRRLMDSIRAEVNSINQIEESALSLDEAKFQTDMRLLFTVIVVSSLLVILLTLSFAYLIYRETQQRIKNVVHLETRHFLEAEQELNKQLQQTNVALQVSEDKLVVTLNSIGDAVIATDVDGRVALLNPVAEQLTGWAKADAIGRPAGEIFRIINEETRQPAAMPVTETLKHGTIQGLANHTILIARDDSEISIADSCAPIRDREDRVVGAVLVFRDVTERTRLDHALHEKNLDLEYARSVAEKANLAKSEFLSSMSHELRSPLNAILGFAQLMESDSLPPTSAQKQSISQILQAGWHLLKLINEVLDLAKVEAGQVSLSPEPVSLAEVMLECHGMVESQAQQHGIELIFPRFDIPCFVRADRTRVKQVLINLLSNAIKYSIKQGTVKVEYAESAPGRIRVSIRDSGAGLSQEQMSQLFQAFNRLGQEAGGVEGTGIGLVVAKRLVELMGGEIGVESAVGEGSVFWFELLSVDEPRLLLETGGIAALEALHLNGEHGAYLNTVLYVEDNPANLKLVEQIIARHPGIHLLAAINGTSGIEIARASLPDVILMDINLPDINGFEALKILRSDPSTLNIPVVALSANAMPRDIQKGMDLGFFRYITKPIKLTEFMTALNDALKFAKKSNKAYVR
jgi:PAS domain S-box-containing protein